MPAVFFDQSIGFTITKLFFYFLQLVFILIVVGLIHTKVTTCQVQIHTQCRLIKDHLLLLLSNFELSNPKDLPFLVQITRLLFTQVLISSFFLHRIQITYPLITIAPQDL